MLWNSGVLEYSPNRLKQDVLSTILFSLSPEILYIYMDPLLLKLNESGYGFYLNGIYIGALAYADNTTNSLNRRDFNKMILLYYIYFNMKISICVK